MRLIDADALLDELSNLEPRCANKYVKQGINDGLHYYMPKILGEQPTIDAVAVVRCKDCKHRGGLMGRPPFMFYICTCAEGLTGAVRDENYCSYGERKDGDG